MPNAGAITSSLLPRSGLVCKQKVVIKFTPEGRAIMHAKSQARGRGVQFTDDMNQASLSTKHLKAIVSVMFYVVMISYAKLFLSQQNLFSGT